MNQEQVTNNLSNYSMKALLLIATEIDYMLYAGFLNTGKINTKLWNFMDTIQNAIANKEL